jgi:uncharacterized protein YnzC (UPF0291/DUF896 family)
MAEMSIPSRKMAQRFLTELPWEGRLFAYLTNLMSGGVQEFIFSLPQAADFLHGDVETLYERSGTVGYIDAKVLETWVRDKIGDEELSEAIHAIVMELDACPNDVKRQLKEIEIIEPLGNLVRQRVKQCKVVLEKANMVKEGT